MTTQTYSPTANVQTFVTPSTQANETILLMQFPLAIEQPDETQPRLSEKPSCQWIEQDGRLVCHWSFPE